MTDDRGVPHETTAREDEKSYLTGPAYRILNRDNSYDSKDPFIFFPLIAVEHPRGWYWRSTTLENLKHRDMDSLLLFQWNVSKIYFIESMQKYRTENYANQQKYKVIFAIN